MIDGWDNVTLLPDDLTLARQTTPRRFRPYVYGASPLWMRPEVHRELPTRYVPPEVTADNAARFDEWDNGRALRGVLNAIAGILRNVP